MKQKYIVLLLLSIVLALTVYKLEKKQTVNTMDTTISTTGQSILMTETDNVVEKKQMHFYIGNNETTADVIQFSGEGYSIYVLEDNWSHRTDLENGYTADIWQNTENLDTALWILKMDASNLSTAQLWIKETFGEYDLLEDNRGGLGGTNADGHMVDAQIFSNEVSTYILIKMYAMENSEIAGSYLTVMADTFELL